MYHLIGKWNKERAIEFLGKCELLSLVEEHLRKGTFNSKDVATGINMHQSLPSGLRATDLFNTIFNRVLSRIADAQLEAIGVTLMRSIQDVAEAVGREMFRSLEEEDKRPYERACTVHIGDDFVVWTKKRVRTLLKLYSLVAMGSRMQAFKQQVSRSKAELLRRWIGQFSMCSFAARAVGNFNSPPVQAMNLPDPVGDLLHRYD